MIRFQCQSCGKMLQVPDEHAGKRGKCIGCGAAVMAPTAQEAVPTFGEAPPQVIEKTSKTWKRRELLSMAVLFSGVAVLLTSFLIYTQTEDHYEMLTWLGSVFFAVGLVWFSVVRFLIWWHHG